MMLLETGHNSRLAVIGVPNKVIAFTVQMIYLGFDKWKHLFSYVDLCFVIILWKVYKFLNRLWQSVRGNARCISYIIVVFVRLNQICCSHFLM
jgi:hypothetical protein